MKRGRTIGLTAATATATLAFASVPGRIDAAPVWVEPTADNAASAQTGANHHSADTRPVIDVRHLADKPLTPALKQAIGAAAVVETKREVASGIRISPDRYLTSGHVFIADNGEPIPGCNPTQTTTANGTSAITRAASKAVIVRHSSPNADIAHDERDVALLQTSEYAKGAVASLAAKNHDLTPGTPVVFSNDEPTGTGSYRDPRTRGLLHNPAVFNGVVLEDAPGDNGQIVILTGVGVSYNHPSERLTRPGASGGGITTYDGVTRAITTATDADSQGHMKYDTVANIEQRFNVNIVGETSDHAQITYAQPVNTSLLRSLGSLSNIASQPCA